MALGEAWQARVPVAGGDGPAETGTEAADLRMGAEHTAGRTPAPAGRAGCVSVRGTRAACTAGTCERVCVWHALTNVSLVHTAPKTSLLFAFHLLLVLKCTHPHTYTHHKVKTDGTRCPPPCPQAPSKPVPTPLGCPDWGFLS